MPLFVFQLLFFLFFGCLCWYHWGSHRLLMFALVVVNLVSLISSLCVYIADSFAAARNALIVDDGSSRRFVGAGLAPLVYVVEVRLLAAASPLLLTCVRVRACVCVRTCICMRVRVCVRVCVRVRSIVILGIYVTHCRHGHGVTVGVDLFVCPPLCVCACAVLHSRFFTALFSISTESQQHCLPAELRQLLRYLCTRHQQESQEEETNGRHLFPGGGEGRGRRLGSKGMEITYGVCHHRGASITLK